MNVLSFNFTKINGERSLDFRPSDISTNIQFIDISKDEIAILKDSEVLKVIFSFNIEYKSAKDSKKQSQISFEGIIHLSAGAAESKEILDSWKNKDLPQQFKDSLFNLILDKCSVKALSLEEDLSLPYHLPLPKIQNLKKKE
jgi:hypothetical protein